jgi:hypothetical protein
LPEFTGGIFWSGSIRIVVESPTRRQIISLRNGISDAGLNLMRDALAGLVSDAEVKYVALGTGSTAPGPGDTKLVAEVLRKAVIKLEVSGTGQVQTTGYIAPYQGNHAVQEIGWFAGAGAGPAADSGVLVARVLYARMKIKIESWQIVRTDTSGGPKMPYTKNDPAWTNGGAPGISAERLNHLETQYDEAKGDLDGKMNQTTGHTHAGVVDSGPKTLDGSLASGVATASTAST